MPGIVENKSTSRILFVPDASLESCSKSPPEMVKLRNPKTDQTALFLHCPASKSLCEVLAFSEENRSWFLGEKISSDGRILLATKVDPRFLLLPYLAKAERLVPLPEMLEDDDYPALERLLVDTKGLDMVADSKGDKDLNVWKYNEEKTLNWLAKKLEKVAGLLEKKGVDITAGAAANNFKHAANLEATEVEFKRYALGIVSEYLTPELAEKLKDKLGLPEPEKPSTKRMGDGELPKAKKLKTGVVEGPTDDYSKGVKKETGNTGDLTSKQKALAVSAKGSKNIMSFFKKK